jgi:hypothetical protein
MTDADLIYNALLRAERRAEDWARAYDEEATRRIAGIALTAIRFVREEICNGLSKERH